MVKRVMRMVRTAGFALLAAAVLSEGRAAPRLTADERAQLAAGEAIVRVAQDKTGEADAIIEAAIDIAAPPARVYAVMIDCPRAPKFVDGLKSCRVLERAADGLSDVREHHSQLMALFPEIVSVFRSTYVSNREIRFERVRGDLKFLKGAWTLEPRSGGSGTRLMYQARVGASLQVPAFIVRGALEQDVPKLLRALRREVLSGN